MRWSSSFKRIQGQPAMDIKWKLGRKLREIRLAKGMSLQELARRAGFHQTYMANIERGLENPTVEAVERLAGVLDTRMKTFFDFDPDDHVDSDSV